MEQPAGDDRGARQELASAAVRSVPPSCAPHDDVLGLRLQSAHRHPLVNARVVPAVVDAFRQIYGAWFPIRQMVPIAAYGGDDNKSMAADNTSSFNCRAAVSNGPKTWSMHAFGEAIDINTVENPYTLDGTVRPPSGKPYTDRSRVRRGMIVRGSTPTRAFSAVGWGWGGNWSSSPDYQHFSTNGK